VVSLKPTPDGQRRRKKVPGRSKTELTAATVRLALKELAATRATDPPELAHV
jgi:hypothetical protein